MSKVIAEYNEGDEAGERFKELATALFQIPKNGRVPHSFAVFE